MPLPFCDSLFTNFSVPIEDTYSNQAEVSHVENTSTSPVVLSRSSSRVSPLLSTPRKVREINGFLSSPSTPSIVAGQNLREDLTALALSCAELKENFDDIISQGQHVDGVIIDNHFPI